MTKRYVNVLSITVVLVLALALSCGGTNCKDPLNANSVQCVVEGAVVDCTGVASLSAVIPIVEPIVTGLIQKAQQADGSIDWPSIEGQLVQLALQYGMCVISEIWQKLMNPPTSGPGSAAVATKQIVDPTSARSEFERIRAKVAPGTSFVTRVGKL